MEIISGNLLDFFFHVQGGITLKLFDRNQIRTLMTHLYTKFHWKKYMYDRGIERKLYAIRQNDGRTERANTICPVGAYKSQRVTFDEISLKTMWKSCNFAAQKDPSMIVFLGWSVNKDGHPSLWLASTFLAKLQSKACLWNGNVCLAAGCINN